MASVFSRLRVGVGGGFGGGANLRQANVFGVANTVSPSAYYTPGTGTPAISTADYYHTDGNYWLRPYDLTLFGSAGATAAANGRYFWVCGPDHTANSSWGDGVSFMGGYSSDPGVLPASLGLLFRETNVFVRGGTENNTLYQVPYLVYNPDDATYPFYIFAEGSVTNGVGVAPHTVATSHEEGLARSTDLVTWVMHGPSHFNLTGNAWSSFQRVVRAGVGDWYSVGLATSITGGYGGFGKWTSTDALTFTQVSNLLQDVIGNSVIQQAGTDTMSIGGQIYALVREDLYNIPPYGGQTYAKGSLDPLAVQLGQYVTLWPIDANYNGLASPAPIRISSVHAGVFPGPTYLQIVNGLVEDGVLHAYTTRGFFVSASNFNTVDDAPYLLGGGLRESMTDYYTYIYDASAAAAAAPCGVTASCAAGVVTLSWYDALPANTYRVKRYTSAANAAANTSPTTVGDVSGTAITDSPTVGSQYWWRVITLQSGTERGYRIVHAYVSSATTFVNKHISRVIDAGGDVTTIDATWLTTVDAWLTSNDCHKYLLHWANPAFGTKKSGSTVQKIYDIGTTRLPRGGDYTPTTSNTTYSATGMNATVPGWTNPNTTDYAYFGAGRLNQIRRKVQITFVAAYKKFDTNTATLIAIDEFYGLGLQHTSGSPGSASFYIHDVAHTVTATASPASATAANIIAGTFDGTNVTCYANGTAGTPQSGLDPNIDLSARTALRGQRNDATQIPLLVSGSKDSKFQQVPQTLSFDNSEAKWSASDLIVFEKGLSGSLITSLTSMLRTRIGA